MLPNISFSELIWAYIPGLPISLCLYFHFVEPIPIITYWTKPVYPAGNALYIILILVTPLVIGVVVDAFRHGLTLIFECVCRCICNGTREYKRPFWDFSKDSVVDVQESEAVKSYVLARSLLFYHMYEFFFDLGISLLVTGGLLLWLFESQQCLAYLLLFVGVPLSIIFAAIYAKMRDRIVEAHKKPTIAIIAIKRSDENY